MLVGIAALACVNALQIPLTLESQIASHPQTGTMSAFGAILANANNGSIPRGALEIREEPLVEIEGVLDATAWAGVLGTGQPIQTALLDGMREAYRMKECPNSQYLTR